MNEIDIRFGVETLVWAAIISSMLTGAVTGYVLHEHSKDWRSSAFTGLGIGTVCVCVILIVAGLLFRALHI